MKCQSCGKPMKFGQSILTPQGVREFCEKSPCKSAAVELKKYLASLPKLKEKKVGN